MFHLWEKDLEPGRNDGYRRYSVCRGDFLSYTNPKALEVKPFHCDPNVFFETYPNDRIDCVNCKNEWIKRHTYD